MQPFNNRRDKLSMQDGCMLWKSRVVVLKVGHEKVLDELREGHPGVLRMKGLARRVVWWPGIDKHIEERVKSCYSCQQGQKSPREGTSVSMGMAKLSLVPPPRGLCRALQGENVPNNC